MIESSRSDARPTFRESQYLAHISFISAHHRDALDTDLLPRIQMGEYRQDGSELGDAQDRMWLDSLSFSVEAGIGVRGKFFIVDLAPAVEQSNA